MQVRGNPVVLQREYHLDQARYARRRWLDILLVLLATDALVRLFSNRQPLLLPLRQLALTLLGRWPLLRRLSLQAMSEGPCRLLGA